MGWEWGMKGNRKENGREGEKELLHLFVKWSRQGFEGKTGIGKDGREGKGGRGR
jgi:hypothetical protein